MRRLTLLLLLAAVPLAAAPTPAQRVREWRIAHEKEIVAELMQFLAIPNIASDRENIERNAQAIVALFAKRGIEARLLRVEGAPPLVVADVRSPNAKQTVAFYAHYDGQPVDPTQWATPPWEPVMKGDRIYGRSASDDKAPIIGFLAALDALRAANVTPTVNLKFLFEGEEEAGSPHLAQYLENFAPEV